MTSPAVTPPNPWKRTRPRTLASRSFRSRPSAHACSSGSPSLPPWRSRCGSPPITSDRSDADRSPLSVTDGSEASAETSSWSVAFQAVAVTPLTCQRASISASSSSTVAPNWAVTTGSAPVAGGPTVTLPSRTATTCPLASARHTTKSQSVESYWTTSVERRLGGRHVAVEAVLAEQLVEDVAVGRVGVVAALQAAGHAHRLVAALQRQERAVLAHAHAVLDDDPLEHGLGLAAGSRA